MTQGQLAERSNIDQSVISKLERGKHAGSVYTVTFARITGVRPEWLAEEIGSMLGDTAQVADHMQNDEYAFIPVLSAKAAAGVGYENSHVEEQSTLAFRREWMQRFRLKEHNLRLIRADGESMMPSIADGDMLLIDIHDKEPASGRIYAIQRPDFSISVKRLVQRFSGEWEIVSDNASFENERVENLNSLQAPILGKVCWRGGIL